MNALVEASQFSARLAICQSCEHMRKGPIYWICSQCNCPLQKKAKYILAHCPLNPPKW